MQVYYHFICFKTLYKLYHTAFFHSLHFFTQFFSGVHIGVLFHPIFSDVYLLPRVALIHSLSLLKSKSTHFINMPNLFIQSFIHRIGFTFNFSLLKIIMQLTFLHMSLGHMTIHGIAGFESTYALPYAAKFFTISLLSFCP